MSQLPRRTVPVVLAALAGLVAVPAVPAHAAPYTFVKVADSVLDDFEPTEFGCASINDAGQIAFRAGRPQPNFNTDPGIYRANADNSLVVIAQRPRYNFLSFNPSMNDQGVVAFAANVDGGPGDDFEAILVGAGTNRVGVVADTRGEFAFFGFDVSINNGREVAFRAELDDDGAEGLFSGRRGGPLTTHFLNTTSQFDGSDARPSINDSGDIAFGESVDFADGVFVGQEGEFATLSEPSEEVSTGEPLINNNGVAAFERSYVDGDEFVLELVTNTAGGTPTVVVDTRGPFREFGFRPPSLNDDGQLAFLGRLDNNDEAIYVVGQPSAGPVDRVIGVDDTLDGDEITGIRFCEEGLNNEGQLTFVADFFDEELGGLRTTVYRATRG